ncbi:hypothetical protein AAFF27_07220 [Xylophilus sp. GW821-FHT01B05]
MSDGTSMQIRPFWQRLSTFAAFPLQGGPLLYAAGILGLSLVGSLPAILFGAPVLMGIVWIGVMLAASRYACQVIALGARGLLRAKDYPREKDPDWEDLPRKLFAILLLQGALAFASARLHAQLPYLVMLLASLALPATIMVLVHSCSLRQAINPGLVWGTIRVIGWRPYLLLCLLLFVLLYGMDLAAGLLLPWRSAWLGWLLLIYINIYGAWAMASMIGYVMYQYHLVLGIDPLPRAGEQELTPAQATAAQADAQLAQLLDKGDVAGALLLTGQALRAQPDNLAAHRRHHRVLLQSDQAELLCGHAQQFLALLIQGGFASEALQVYRVGRERDPAFAPATAQVVLALARHAWHGDDAQGVLQLLSGFDRRFPDDPAIPQAYGLAALVLVQGLHRADQARPILQALERRYPDSEQTQQVRWLLRDGGEVLTRA